MKIDWVFGLAVLVGVAMGTGMPTGSIFVMVIGLGLLGLVLEVWRAHRARQK